MPIYEYICKKCCAKFEELQSMNSSAPPCPNCRSEEVEKCISTFGFTKSETSFSSSGSLGGSSCSSCSGGNCSACK